MKYNKIWLVLFLIFVVGCGNAQNADGEQQTENLTQTENLEQKESSKQEEIQEQSATEKLVYTSDYVGNVDEIVIDENGHVYAIGWQDLKKSNEEKNGNEFTVITYPKQWLYEFDADGKCLSSGEMTFSSGEAMALEWSDGYLYMVVPGVNQHPVLYQVDNLSTVYEMHEVADAWPWDTLSDYDRYTQWLLYGEGIKEDYLKFNSLNVWTLEELYRFDMFSEINRLVFMGDRIYVYGMLANPNENPLVQNLEYAENYPNTYKGQAIGYLDKNNLDAGVTLLSMDGVPQDMIKFDENTLGIYMAGEDEACFWKYIPAKETWEKTDIAVNKESEAAKDSAVYGEFAAYETGCFYVKTGNVVCYNAGNGTEQELFQSEGVVTCLKTDGTFLYYYTHVGETKKIKRVEISKLFESQNE